MEQIEIVHAIEVMEQGRTRPYLCEADDCQKYIFKGTEATYEGLVKECIAAELGIEFGLPIPEFRLAFIDQDFASYSIINTHCDFGFASSYQPNIQDVKYQELNELETQTLRDLFFFDYWIKNGDRCLTEHGGNPNFFVDQKSGKPIVVDHNLAFDTEFELEKHFSIHVGSKFWGGLQLIDKDYYEEKCSRAMTKLNAVISKLPEAWLDFYPADRIQKEITLVLQRFKDAEFWEGIK